MISTVLCLNGPLAGEVVRADVEREYCGVDVWIEGSDPPALNVVAYKVFRVCEGESMITKGHVLALPGTTPEQVTELLKHWNLTS